MGKTGPKPYQTTDKDKQLVERAAAIGMTGEQIAKLLSIAESTLWKYYKSELSTGGLKANMNVAAALYKKCIEGNVTAQIFWCKTRLGWRETVDITNANLIPVINLGTKDRTKS